MVSRVLVAVAALIAVAHAATDFALRWKPNTDWEMVEGTFATPLECFANTNTTIKFTHGFTYPDSYVVTGEANGDTTLDAISCETSTGQTNVYSDMVYAYPRGGGAAVCLRKLRTAATLATLTKPDATKTTFNQNFKYAITRNLQVCAYDSRYALYNGAKTTSLDDREQKDELNADAKIKLSYQADTWKIYTSNWDGALQTGVASQDFEDISSWCAGHCGDGTNDIVEVWNNPGNELYDDEDFSPTARDEKPFLADGCKTQSGFTCAPSAANPAVSCDMQDVANNENWQVDSGTGASATVESSACGSSVELLARSANFAHTTFDTDNFNLVDGSSQTLTVAPGLDTNYLRTVLPKFLDQTIGIHEDILAMWTEVSSKFAPTITGFQGAGVGGPQFQPGKTFWLNNGELAYFNFEKANTEYQQIGFATTGVSNQKNQILLDTDLTASEGVRTQLTQVSFNRDASMAYFLAQNGLFTGNQGTGNFGSVGNHYWARVRSSYDIQIQWTCKNIGAATGFDPNSDIQYPYRFTCDNKINGDDGWTSTPGRKYNNNANKVPSMKRQFTKTFWKQWQQYSFVATSDPVYLGQFISASNAGYGLATPVAAVNGNPRLVEATTEQDSEMKKTVAYEDQADAVALVGAGVVILAVFGSLSICIGAFILGKLQTK